MKDAGLFARFRDPELVFRVVTFACLAAFAVFAVAVFGKLFLLVEYRSWATPLNVFNPLKILDPATLFDPTALSVARSRALSFLATGLFASMCGIRPSCHDVIHIAVLTAAGLFLALVLRRLLPRAPLLVWAGALLFFLFGEPMLEGLAWQATILDKLALFFTGLGLYVAARLDPERRDPVSLLVANAAGLAIVFCAYNAKEAAFSLMPAMVALLALRALDRAPAITLPAAGRALRAALTLFAAPAAYGVFHLAVVYVNRTFFNAAEAARVMGGDAVLNAYHFLLYLTNGIPFATALGLYPYAPRGEALAIVACCAVLALAAGAAIAARAPRRIALLWLWAAGSFTLALLIPLRTTAGQPFYLLVPSFYFAVLLAVTAVGLMQAFPAPRALAGVNALVAFVLIAHAAGFAWREPEYAYRVTMSANFTAVLGRVRAELARTPKPAAIKFLWPQDESRAYMFLAPRGDSALAQYLVPGGSSYADVAALDKVIDDAPYAGPPPHPAAAPGTITVVLGRALALDALVPPAR